MLCFFHDVTCCGCPTTLCSKKSDAKIQITITTAYLIRIKYPLNCLKYHLSDLNVANFNKSTAKFLSNSCFKNETQKQQFPIWKILIEETSSLSNRTMLQLTELGDTVEFLSRNTPDFISPLLWPPNSPDLNPVDYEVWDVLQ